MGRKKIARKMIRLHERWTGGPLTAHSKAATKVYKDPNDPLFASYYILGLLFDGVGGGDAERAWSSPHYFRKRIGHLDWAAIADLDIAQLAAIVQGTEAADDFGALFKYYNNMAKYIQRTASIIATKYGGDPSRIWHGRESGGEVVRRFWELPGLGQKRASMAANLLHREYHFAMSTSDIDVSVDIQVMRTFVRTGLSKTRKKAEIIRAARKQSPEYPGALDYPAWRIGKVWCRPGQPHCEESEGTCPLVDLCPRNPIDF